MTTSIFAFGLGVGTHNKKGEWLEIFYPEPVLSPGSAIVNCVTELGLIEGNNANLSTEQLMQLESSLIEAGEAEQAKVAGRLIHSQSPVVAVVLTQDSPPSTVPEAYLKLHLLSHRLVRPHGTDLTGAFGILPNVAWTNEGAIDLAELPQRQLAARLKGEVLEVSCVDKFPKMTNYVVPEGVRIAHTARVRLGAYLGKGTTIMHEGFVNFNAGTEGPGMIEGRISAGVTVGKGSDLGGGASIIGTLSGGGKIIISVGEECLIGANAGIGFPLGDRCTVEAGLYVTAGTKVVMLDSDGNTAESVKARDLAGKSDLLFRRNSISGAVECLTNRSAVKLNAELHAHN
ncbi:MAG: 2,3,4,5-tetrahydropyridine-2,6-dicarboxylate N-succinyltransferase [Proteobacteria bacterium]|nr:2,3,4,5-tetrahydropyridine-2,6-dicarboxylate N-succinyltransferase [Pseudomonadota bacterium]